MLIIVSTSLIAFLDPRTLSSVASLQKSELIPKRTVPAFQTSGLILSIGRMENPNDRTEVIVGPSRTTAPTNPVALAELQAKKIELYFPPPRPNDLLSAGLNLGADKRPISRSIKADAITLYRRDQCYQIVQHIAANGLSMANSGLSEFIQYILGCAPLDRPPPVPLGLSNNDITVLLSNTWASPLSVPNPALFQLGPPSSSPITNADVRKIERIVQLILNIAVAAGNLPLVAWCIDPHHNPSRTWEDWLALAQEHCDNALVSDAKSMADLTEIARASQFVLFHLALTHSHRHRAALKLYLDQLHQPQRMLDIDFLSVLYHSQMSLAAFWLIHKAGFPLSYDPHITTTLLASPGPEALIRKTVLLCCPADDIDMFSFLFDLCGGAQHFFAFASKPESTESKEDPSAILGPKWHSPIESAVFYKAPRILRFLLTHPEFPVASFFSDPQNVSDVWGLVFVDAGNMKDMRDSFQPALPASPAPPTHQQQHGFGRDENTPSIKIAGHPAPDSVHLACQHLPLPASEWSIRSNATAALLLDLEIPAPTATAANSPPAPSSHPQSDPSPSLDAATSATLHPFAIACRSSTRYPPSSSFQTGLCLDAMLQSRCIAPQSIIAHLSTALSESSAGLAPFTELLRFAVLASLPSLTAAASAAPTAALPSTFGQNPSTPTNSAPNASWTHPLFAAPIQLQKTFSLFRPTFTSNGTQFPHVSIHPYLVPEVGSQHNQGPTPAPPQTLAAVPISALSAPLLYAICMLPSRGMASLVHPLMLLLRYNRTCALVGATVSSTSQTTMAQDSSFFGFKGLHYQPYDIPSGQSLRSSATVVSIQGGNRRRYRTNPLAMLVLADSLAADLCSPQTLIIPANTPYELDPTPAPSQHDAACVTKVFREPLHPLELLIGDFVQCLLDGNEDLVHPVAQQECTIEMTVQDNQSAAYNSFESDDF